MSMDERAGRRDAEPDGRSWGGDRLDLPAYLDRLGDDGPQEPTLETLRRLHRAHIAAIPFENLDVILGRPVLVDLESVQDKLVRRRRGGYCYEQNTLFAAVLERLGYPVRGLAARVLMGSRKIRPATHALLRIEIDGHSWLADVGFGGGGLLEPIELRDGAEARQGGWTIRLDREDSDEWVLRSLTPDGWLDLYSFGLDRQYHADFGVRNHFVSTSPRSPFVTRIVVQRYDERRQRALDGDTLTTTFADGARETAAVTLDELPALLTDELGIVLDVEEREAVLRYAREKAQKS
ncbi:arylamine N-acetyltransferase family protein [Streptoalloteichus hindustanus]|uniref:N-hydroxyarylamine O-acetyltransferase n=1 Tax=Streptoalloteichus hindustanus TaxID=2017 RepID=A0A1M5B875_STRHI|nr:arylamine N-acetyltransferase [Streptoalloteichus hindustanus]SHF38382.1 N-hydroxyarylamine O-acetyltransferase [Streptoalloteichus hindustanus]